MIHAAEFRQGVRFGMQHTRRSTFLVALLPAMLLAAALPAMAQDWKIVRVAVEGAYPPFNEVAKNGKLAGFDVDIANALCGQMKVDCTLVRQSWDQIQDGLIRRDTDAIISSLSINDSRRLRYDFTNKYYQTPAKFVARKGANIQITPVGLKGKRIGVQRNTTHEAFLKADFGNVIALQSFPTIGDATAALAAGKVDLVLADSWALSLGFLATSQGKGYELVGPDFTDKRFFGEGVGIAVRKSDSELRDRYNQALSQIRADGTYDRIARKYFSFNIYGG
jgi:arginine/ornithine transport system substrate-binding protein